jgi:hypothetical protein
MGVNLVQSGVYQAVMAWVVYVALVILHVTEFREYEAIRRMTVYNVYYFLLVSWYIGIVVSYLVW